MLGQCPPTFNFLPTAYTSKTRVSRLFINSVLPKIFDFGKTLYLLENFMVHCVFSDSLKQFYRYQNDSVTASEILKHEAALLDTWYLHLRVQLAQAALMAQNMDEELFLKTVIHADKVYYHYPDWFARCADLFS